MNKERSTNVKKILTSLFLFLLIIIIAYLAGIFRKSCFDEACFEKSLSRCSPTEYIKQKNNNIYVYSIAPSYLGECTIEIQLAKIAPGSEQQVRKLLEGKSMRCIIPKTFLKMNNLDNIDNILQYCHGELKEGILELIIEKMYAQIIINLDDIVQESRAFLKEV